MTITTHSLYPLLKTLETELRKVGLWSSYPPSPEAMSSVMPFMYDTLKPFEWLQWVFIPRTQAILEAGARIPGNCNIHPLMEHYLARREDIDSQALLALILELDNTMSALGSHG